MRDYDVSRPRGGTVIVQGTSAMAGVTSVLPEIRKRNVKVVCIASAELFAMQHASYRNEVLSDADRFDSTVITTQARKLMHDFLYNKTSEEYAVCADWDNRWRTGGTLDEVLDEAHLTPVHILQGIERFSEDRERRISGIKSVLEKM